MADGQADLNAGWAAQSCRILVSCDGGLRRGVAVAKSHVEQVARSSESARQLAELRPVGATRRGSSWLLSSATRCRFVAPRSRLRRLFRPPERCPAVGGQSFGSRSPGLPATTNRAIDLLEDLLEDHPDSFLGKMRDIGDRRGAPPGDVSG